MRQVAGPAWPHSGAAEMGAVREDPPLRHPTSRMKEGKEAEEIGVTRVIRESGAGHARFVRKEEAASAPAVRHVQVGRSHAVRAAVCAVAGERVVDDCLGRIDGGAKA